MKYWIKIWDLGRKDPHKKGAHIATVVIDRGTVFDTWWNDKHLRGSHRIGKKGEGKCKVHPNGLVTLGDGILPNIVCYFFLKGTWRVGQVGKPPGDVSVTTPPSPTRDINVKIVDKME